MLYIFIPLQRWDDHQVRALLYHETRLALLLRCLLPPGSFAHPYNDLHRIGPPSRELGRLVLGPVGSTQKCSGCIID
jgi:hypothetical protein